LEQIQRINYGENFDSDEARPTGNGTYVIELPLTKLAVEVKLMTGQDENTLLKSAEKKKKLKLPESALTDQFRAIIVSVNDHKEQSTINTVIERLPARDAKYLRNVYSKVNPNVELKGNFECDNCDHIEEVDVPITVQFFWPKQ
jgi:dsRNA-specific ribonuclease